VKNKLIVTAYSPIRREQKLRAFPILILVSLLAIQFAEATEQKTAPEKTTQTPHLYFGCEIYDIQNIAAPKLVRMFAGEYCLFQKDGSVIQTLSERVVKYDRNMKELWSLPTKAHHQVNASVDGSQILILGSEAVEPDKQHGLARSDVLFVLDQSGEVKKKFSFYDNSKQVNKLDWDMAVKRRHRMQFGFQRFKDLKYEITHANSFYEIGPHAAEELNPAFKRGNYIVNDGSLMMAFVLDSSLTKIVWQRRLRRDWHLLHDLQVLPTGRLFFYDNGPLKNGKSQLVETDLATWKDVWTYRGPEGKRFFAKRSGGVQRLADGGTLYTISNRPEIIEIDANGKKRWSWYPGDNKHLQQARKDDLSEFLANNGAI
jgi:hypothetical protein